MSHDSDLSRPPARGVAGGASPAEPAPAPERSDGRRPGLNGGWLMPPWKPGDNPNPGGRMGKLRAVRQMARNKSRDTMAKLAAIVDNEPDNRVVVVAAQTLLTWAWGDPRNLPSAEEAAGTIDLTKLPAPLLRALVRAIDRGEVRVAEEGAESGSGPVQIDGTAEQSAE